MENLGLESVIPLEFNPVGSLSSVKAVIFQVLSYPHA